jgi:hypothetical protein
MTVRWLLLLCALLFPAAHASGADVEEVRACLEKNAPKKSSVQTVKLTARDRTGSEQNLDGKIYWKPTEQKLSRVLIEIEAPADVRGSAYLLLEKEGGDEMFTYLPELKKARRLQTQTASGSLFGTDFTYDDFSYLQSVAGRVGTERLPDAELEPGSGRKAWVVQVKPPEEPGVKYERVVAFVDPERCVPIKIEFYEVGGALWKVLSVDPAKVEPVGAIFVPKSIVMKDVKNETESRIVVEKIDVDGDVADRLFTVTNLERGH